MTRRTGEDDPMPKLAGHIDITCYGVTIDGEPFPWLLSDPEHDPVQVRRSGGVSVVFVPVLAESVSIDLRWPTVE